MTTTPAEAELRSLIAELTRERPEAIDLGVPMDRQRLDSLQLIILRERLETNLAVAFSDDEWMALDTPASVLARVTSQTSGAPSSGPEWARTDLEIGMPLTGRNNLAETPLLQYLGDQRWRHLSEIVGVPSREIVDDAGARLYATFYYVEVAFPPGRPMASFGENDRLTVFSSVARYGTSMVDGISYLVPERRCNERALHVGAAGRGRRSTGGAAVEHLRQAVRRRSVVEEGASRAPELRAHSRARRSAGLVRGDERSRADWYVWGAALRLVAHDRRARAAGLSARAGSRPERSGAGVLRQLSDVPRYLRAGRAGLGCSRPCRTI